MLTLTGENVYLRALEPEDLEFVHTIENDESIWDVSHTQAPLSKFVLRQYLENATQDIYEARQLRLAICHNGTFEALGLIDLFDFDPKNGRAGVGIVIKNISDRGNGYGSEALGLLVNYGFTHLGLHQLYANIDPANARSVQLFTKFGFAETGRKKEWNFIGGKYRDEAVFQLINQQH